MSDTTSCKCNCGYTCGRSCGLSLFDCIAQHFVKDCDHEWSGWEEYTDIDRDGKPYVSGGGKVCSKCGTSAMVHDMRVGP